MPDTNVHLEADQQENNNGLHDSNVFEKMSCEIIFAVLIFTSLILGLCYYMDYKFAKAI